MSFYNNKRESGKNVVRSKMAARKSIAGSAKRWLTRKVLFPAIYHFYALKPIEDDKVIFMEIRFSELTDSYVEIFNELICNYNLNIHCHFFQQGTVAKNIELKKQIDFIKDAATAKYLIYNDSSDTQGSFKVRKGTKVLNTWHAAGAFKKFGFSTANKIFGGSQKEKEIYNLHPKYDIVTVSSPEIVWAYIEAMGKEKEPDSIKPLGLSRSDVFYRQSFIDAAFEHLYDVLPQAKGKKVILYAPTFRGTPRKAITPDMLEVGAFYEKFHEDYVLIFKHHPLVSTKPMIPAAYSDFAIDLSDMLTISELLCVSDICITDYSSLIFEFSIFERPMLFFAYDLANYFDWRGFYYNFDELTPGPVCFTNAEMIDYISNVDKLFDKEAVHAFRERFMSSCDGHATERIMNEFFGDRIEKYRRATPIDGDYHTLPEINGLYRDEEKRIDKMKKVMKKAKSAYLSASKQPVISNRIALLMDEKSDWDVFAGLEKALKAEGNDFEIVKDITYNEKNISGFMEKLGRAAVIVCSGEPYIMRMIDVRSDTRLIQICPELVSMNPRWKNSKEIRSGFNVEECKLFPIHSKYDAVFGSVESDDELVAKNYQLSQKGQIYHIGNVTTDMLLSEEYKAEARSRFETVCQYAKNKKVILFICKDRELLPEYLSRVMTALHEKYARNYVCVGMACDGRPGRKLDISEYLEGFGFDPRFVLAKRVALQEAEIVDTEQLYKDEEAATASDINWKKFPPITLMEAISLADVVVGDYCSQVLAVAVANKPLLLWVPDRTTYGKSQEMYMEFDESLSDVTCSNDAELVKKIENIDNYDLGILEKLRMRYFAFCDGQASNRAVDLIKKMH